MNPTMTDVTKQHHLNSIRKGFGSGDATVGEIAQHIASLEWYLRANQDGAQIEFKGLDQQIRKRANDILWSAFLGASKLLQQELQ